MQKYIYIIAGLIGLLLLFGALGNLGDENSDLDPKKWKPSFSKNSTRAYGSYILYERIKDLFPNTKVTVSKKTIHDYIIDTYYKDFYAEQQNALDMNYAYIFFNTDFSPGNDDIQQLNYFLSNGNHVFIAAQEFGQSIKDNFHINTNYEPSLKKDSAIQYFTDPNLTKGKKYKIKPDDFDVYFTDFDSTKALVLAKNVEGKPILLKYKTESGGDIYLCSHPLLFTNFHLLKESKDGAALNAHVLSHLPQNSRIIWDEYYKIDNLERIAEGQSEIMRFIKSESALYTAFWVIIVTAILYTIFEMKRRQRIIPAITTPQNSSLAFTETIGRLYFQSQDHKNIAEKKIRYFLEHIRNRYYMRTQELDKEFCDLLAHKSGVETAKINELFTWIMAIRNRTSIKEDDLLALSNRMDDFYTLAK